MTTTQQEEAANDERIRLVVAALEKMTGDTWADETPAGHWNRWYRRPDGLGIIICIHRYGSKRLEVSRHLPDSMTHLSSHDQPSPKSITINPDRDVEAIARDIGLRFIPTYAEWFFDVFKPRADKYYADHCAAWTLAHRIAGSFPALIRLPYEYERDEAGRAKWNNIDADLKRADYQLRWYGEAEIGTASHGDVKVGWGGKCVDLNLQYLAPDLAVEILRTVERYESNAKGAA